MSGDARTPTPESAPAPASAFGDGPPPHDAPAPADTDMAELVDQTLAQRFAMLRFPAPLETRFRQDTGPERLKTLTIAGTVVPFVLNIFLISDHAMLPDVFDQALMLRLWLFTPLCLMGMWLMGRTPHLLLRELMAVAASLLACVIEIYLCSISQSPRAAPYITGLALIILYVNVFVRPRFWMAVPASLGMLLAYAVSLWTVAGHNPALSIPIGLILVSTAQFTLYYLYTLEHEERHNYLLALRQRLLKRELTRANEQLEKVSRSDALTQVSNRRHFDEFLERLWQRARGEDAEVSVLMFDVDHFKAYNDLYGHPAGDACLVKLADALKRTLRRPGDLLARYGGEEFIAVLNRTPLSQAQVVAERVRQAVEAMGLPNQASPSHPNVTMSIGVACLRAQDPDASTQRLISLADEALYQAKNGGRNRVWPRPRESA